MSSIAWGVVALALAGGEGPARPRFEVRVVDASGSIGIDRKAIEPEQVSYEVRVMETPADWRDSLYRECKRVGREGRSTVWTVGDRTAVELLRRVQATSLGNVVQAPKVTAFAGGSASISLKKGRAFVVDVDRTAEGPGSVAFVPAVDEVDEGVSVKLTGKRTSAGVRARVAVESTWVGSVMHAKRTEAVGNGSVVGATYDLPQVVEAKVDGDYEIPADGKLLVSLGTATTAVDGRPVVMERLLMVAARRILTEAEEAAIPARPAADGAVRQVSTVTPAPIPARMPTPPLPSRSPLRAIGPDGTPADLPPLPDAQLAEAIAPVGPPSPRPSPQAIGREVMRFDPAVAPARFEPAPIAASNLRLDGHELASGRTQVLRIPLGDRVAIEVRAKVVPSEATPD